MPKVLSMFDVEAASFFPWAVQMHALGVYGLLIGDWPIILCNGITLPLVVTILVLKIRLG